MSDGNRPGFDPHRPQPPTQGAPGGCATAFAVLFGMAFLLPGLCLIVLEKSTITSHSAAALMLELGVALLAALGIWIVVATVRRK